MLYANVYVAPTVEVDKEQADADAEETTSTQAPLAEEPEAVADEKSGCGASVTTAGMLAVAACAGISALCAKRRREDA